MTDTHGPAVPFRETRVRHVAEPLPRTRRYGGHQTRFTIGMVAAGDPGRLPTAATCFNTLWLGGEYPSAAVLEAKLRTAVFESRGFAEAAVAV
jgi:hypothetical protein